eukprot:CAMPEP_0194540946 /NCGR_PEP_ID=MMETSP0253-20130528/81438_1 /TAXON_ID=2966 /ORGANISM="Noctiluca scintillans" /LENGTH=759 /DNA_ID=CAMNT_0039387381 /DNA_START=68 /DNA_END=2347 /DNA_ORIENTATION=-
MSRYSLRRETRQSAFSRSAEALSPHHSDTGSASPKTRRPSSNCPPQTLSEDKRGGLYDARAKGVRSRIRAMMSAAGDSSDEREWCNHESKEVPSHVGSRAGSGSFDEYRTAGTRTRRLSGSEAGTGGTQVPVSSREHSAGREVVVRDHSGATGQEVVGRDVNARLQDRVCVVDPRVARFVDPLGTIVEIRCGGERVRVEHDGTDRAQRYYSTGKDGEFQLVLEGPMNPSNKITIEPAAWERGEQSRRPADHRPPDLPWTEESREPAPKKRYSDIRRSLQADRLMDLTTQTASASSSTSARRENAGDIFNAQSELAGGTQERGFSRKEEEEEEEQRELSAVFTELNKLRQTEAKSLTSTETSHKNCAEMLQLRHEQDMLRSRFGELEAAMARDLRLVRDDTRVLVEASEQRIMQRLQAEIETRLRASVETIAAQVSMCGKRRGEEERIGTSVIEEPGPTSGCSARAHGHPHLSDLARSGTALATSSSAPSFGGNRSGNGLADMRPLGGDERKPRDTSPRWSRANRKVTGQDAEQSPQFTERSERSEKSDLRSTADSETRPSPPRGAGRPPLDKRRETRPVFACGAPRPRPTSVMEGNGGDFPSIDRLGPHGASHLEGQVRTSFRRPSSQVSDAGFGNEYGQQGRWNRKELDTNSLEGATTTDSRKLNRSMQPPWNRADDWGDERGDSLGPWSSHFKVEDSPEPPWAVDSGGRSGSKKGHSLQGTRIEGPQMAAVDARPWWPDAGLGAADDGTDSDGRLMF